VVVCPVTPRRLRTVKILIKPREYFVNPIRRNGLVNDVNKLTFDHGGKVRNLQEEEARRALPLRDSDGEECDPDFANDDEMRALLCQQRSTGKAAPRRLTSQQKKIIGALISAHGENIKKMTMDLKLNKMQHTEGVLKKMIESYNFWGLSENVKSDFRAPKKTLWPRNMKK